ncbi:hypothetical protein RE428_03570 [Marinobacter nanhaiticus D15-8W]|uniref:PEP-CTERM sorting domain-containing protein n=1 Tax=Marinobacter nanhaiticus D15-8W TaxID=626887 RepID=N6VXH5_9GAMM|nr:PEP-CTERM sorting domain-containing protein [Marinobacter nanhaiticus]ENO14965.1 PEP-CTERM sorting domain-containing protein [Marinobacter nanhaiticus D15-8W]BES69339.1 hypothetical protein RE428_03570 [Marinobacter nanhaiticus D15-8W]
MNQSIGKIRVSYIRNTFLCLTTIFFFGVAHAGLIEIEPDDYAEGTDLSNVSPFVTLTYNSPNPIWPPSPVYATTPRFEFPAPTGNLTFGIFGGGPGFCEDDEVTFDCFGGFAITFNQPVNAVSLLAINSGYPPGLQVWWATFDSEGTQLDFGGEYGETSDNYGIPFELQFNVSGVTSLVLGGSGLTNVMEFDRLVLQVPEPRAWSLFGLGLAGLYVMRRKRKGARTTE